ncbi:MAG TPA: hypothetical protein PK020_19505 [Ilumatobacteraceae bacterium]|nr:hypothetical protein [Ilumatobacteraceae bacterium]
MRRAIESFRGEAPRVTPRALPDNAAQEAVNAQLFTGDLKAWRQFATTKGLANSGSGPVRTIYLLNDQWLSWEADVDVARGIIPGDTTYRTYLTSPGLYGEPRFTNYALATTGAEPFPVATRPLGVPAPTSPPTLVTGIDETATTFAVDILDEGDSLTESWTISGSSPGVSEVTQDAVVGNPAPSYALLANGNAGLPAYAYRNFGIASGTVVQVSFDWSYQSGAADAQMIANIMTGVLGSGLQVRYDSVFSRFSISAGTGWASTGSSSLVSSTISLLAHSTWYTVTVQVIANSDGTQTVTASLYLGSGLITSVSITNIFSLGDYVGFVHETSSNSAKTYYDNILVRASGSTGYVPANLATNYVYTFVNDLGEESAPSEASATILRPDGISVTVTTPTVVPSGVSSDYAITTKRIYRAATGNVGTEFLFVAEIALGTADYVDVLTDAQLGEALESELWDLPPDDLEGILALPNGVMVGFRRNQLCLSAQNRPHAWPVSYRLTTDTDIVGIGNVDTTVVIGTESFVYIASGSEPAAYSMSKFEVPYACSSKRSFDYLTGIGVVFSNPDGLMAVQGVGQIRNLTDSVFTREQWQALDPTSIVGVSHNDIYFLFWESGSNRGCYAIDMKPNGFGVVQMAFHASASFVDPIEDKMYLVLDEDNEPDDPSLPIPAAPPVYLDGRTVYEFEGNPSVDMTYRWLSKLWLLEHPAWFTIAQVRAEDYLNLLVRFYGDGVQISEIVVTESTEFTLDEADEYETFQIEILGTSTVRIAQAAEDVTELG